VLHLKAASHFDADTCNLDHKRAYVEPKSKKLAPTVFHRKPVSTPFSCFAFRQFSVFNHPVSNHFDYK
jgi:hypothetical protein